MGTWFGWRKRRCNLTGRIPDPAGQLGDHRHTWRTQLPVVLRHAGPTFNFWKERGPLFRTGTCVGSTPWLVMFSEPLGPAEFVLPLTLPLLIFFPPRLEITSKLLSWFLSCDAASNCFPTPKTCFSTIQSEKMACIVLYRWDDFCWMWIYFFWKKGLQTISIEAKVYSRCKL